MYVAPELPPPPYTWLMTTPEAELTPTSRVVRATARAGALTVSAPGAHAMPIAAESSAPATRNRYQKVEVMRWGGGGTA